MMPGMIMLWAGSVETIPSGWHLCDGTAGTPDLRNKFIACAGDNYDPGDTGGYATHNHFWSSGYFFMDISPGTDIQTGTGYNNFTDYMLLEDNTNSANNAPPFHALCYIMKLN